MYIIINMIKQILVNKIQWQKKKKKVNYVVSIIYNIQSMNDRITCMHLSWNKLKDTWEVKI